MAHDMLTKQWISLRISGNAANIWRSMCDSGMPYDASIIHGSGSLMIADDITATALVSIVALRSMGGCPNIDRHRVLMIEGGPNVTDCGLSHV